MRPARRRSRPRRTVAVGVIAVGLLAAGVVEPMMLSGPADAAPAGFVTRNGTQLVLDGAPFRFTGLNIYNANSNGLCWYAMGGSVLGDSLNAIGSGKAVFRSWFFQQLATSGGARDWTAFDHTLDDARARGLKVDRDADRPVGATAARRCPVGYKDATWYEGGYTQPDPAGIVSYRDWVAEVVGRYKDDPDDPRVAARQRARGRRLQRGARSDGDR